MKRQKLVIIFGPTASGKTDLSLVLAKKFGGEIVSADSRQVYRGLDMGTGKIVLKGNRARGVFHHLIDVASPKRVFSVARYKKLAQKAVQQIHSRRDVPFLVGGTGLYIEALIYDWDFPEVRPDYALRKKLEKFSTEELFKKLTKLDPRRSRGIEQYNPRRLIRAIEIASAIGKTPPLLKRTVYDCLFLGIKISDSKLRQNIDQRLKSRIPGIIREIRLLRKQHVSWHRLISFGLEYRYISWYLQGKLTRDEALDQLRTAIWHYAKRQYTWAKRFPMTWTKSHAEAEDLVTDYLAKKHQ